MKVSLDSSPPSPLQNFWLEERKWAKNYRLSRSTRTIFLVTSKYHHRQDTRGINFSVGLFFPEGSKNPTAIRSSEASVGLLLLFQGIKATNGPTAGF